MLMSRPILGSLTLLASLLVTACTPSETTTVEPEPTTSGTAEVEPPSTSSAETVAEPAIATEETAMTRIGTFESAEHETSGGVELINQDGQPTLIFDDSFATSDGPDLVVVLHRSANLLEESTPPAYPLEEEDYVVIAPLMTISGTQEYFVPVEIDLRAFESVAIWCQAFNATFGVARLQ